MLYGSEFDVCFGTDKSRSLTHAYSGNGRYGASDFVPHCLVQIWPLYYTATFHLTPTVTRDESVEPLDPPPDSKPGDRVYVDGYQHDVAGGWIRFRPAVMSVMSVMSVILYAWCLTSE